MADQIEGRYLDQIVVVHEIPPFLVGGDPVTKQYQIFSKATLEAYIDARVKARKNGITITGIVGNVIEHDDIEGHVILSMLIDGFPRNTNFEKGDNNDPQSKQVILTDNFQLTAPMTVTLNFQ